MIRTIGNQSNTSSTFLGTPPWWERAGKLRGESRSYEVTRREPCPVCGKHSWCLHGHGIAICHRTQEGAKATWSLGGGAGHVHDLDGRTDIMLAPRTPRKATKPKPSKDWASITQRACDEAQRPGSDHLERLAKQWGVGHWVIDALGIGWHGGTWATPEKNAAAEVVGISRRRPDGKKFMVAGSSRGLYFTAGWANGSGPICIVEGVSDAAALLNLGISVVGRSAASPGTSELDELAKLLEHTEEIIVVGENDQKPDGTWPGRDGAEHTARGLADRLGRPIGWCLCLDDAKDARAWVAMQDEDPLTVRRSWVEGLVPVMVQPKISRKSSYRRPNSFSIATLTAPPEKPQYSVASCERSATVVKRRSDGRMGKFIQVACRNLGCKSCRRTWTRYQIESFTWQFQTQQELFYLETPRSTWKSFYMRLRRANGGAVDYGAIEAEPGVMRVFCVVPMPGAERVSIPDAIRMMTDAVETLRPTKKPILRSRGWQIKEPKLAESEPVERQERVGESTAAESAPALTWKVVKKLPRGIKRSDLVAAMKSTGLEMPTRSGLSFVIPEGVSIDAIVGRVVKTIRQQGDVRAEQDIPCATVPDIGWARRERSSSDRGQF